jgi:hypothetical protein
LSLCSTASICWNLSDAVKPEIDASFLVLHHTKVDG